MDEMKHQENITGLVTVDNLQLTPSHHDMMSLLYCSNFAASSHTKVHLP